MAHGTTINMYVYINYNWNKLNNSKNIKTSKKAPQKKDKITKSRKQKNLENGFIKNAWF